MCLNYIHHSLQKSTLIHTLNQSMLWFKINFKITERLRNWKFYSLLKLWPQIQPQPHLTVVWNFWSISTQAEAALNPEEKKRHFFENKPFHRHMRRQGRFTRFSDLRVVSKVEISKASFNRYYSSGWGWKCWFLHC